VCLPPWYVGLLHAADGLPEWPDYRSATDRDDYRRGYRAGRSANHPTRTLHLNGTAR
jgi:hypothetical protein